MTTTSLAYCIVPKCPSTKKRNPEKLFFSVPSGKVRNKWSAVVRRTKISLKGSYYCCEDHFDVSINLFINVGIKFKAFSSTIFHGV